MGLHRAGFVVTGVDLHPQPRYPFRFIQADVLSLDPEWLREFDLVWASPPCQTWSCMTCCRPGLASEYPDLIAPVRELLQVAGQPWVIENVPGSPLLDPIVLCGQMFGLRLYRHRLFEANFPLVAPAHPAHLLPASRAGRWKPGTIMSVAGHVAPITEARHAMGVHWMRREELVEAIPPAYSEWAAHSFLAQRLAT